MYKGVLFFDYDGTLTDKNEKIFFPTEKTRSAIKLLQKKGYIACLATGRSLVYVPQSEIDFDCMITNNGGYTFYKNNVLLKKPFEKELIKEMFEYFNKKGIVFVAENEKHCYVNRINDPNFLEKIHMFNLEQKIFTPYNNEDEDFYKLLLIYPSNDFLPDFRKNFGDKIKITLPHLGLTSCDVNPLGVSKSDGIKAILDYFKISSKNAYAFGDGGNDIDMLNSVKHSVVIGHHSPLLDGMGEFVTDTVKNEGIYKAFLHYGLL